MTARACRFVIAVAIFAAGAGTAAAQPEEPIKGPAATNATRLFYGPTGRSLPKGQVYLGVYGIVIPFVQVGLTDRVSIGAGTPLLFGLDDGQPFWVTPKVQVVNTGSTQVAVGAFHAFGPSFSGGGVAYGVMTRGSDNASLTVGGGVAYALEGGSAGIVMVGGERRLNRRIRFMTENYMSQFGVGLLSGGIRFATSKFSGDFGLGSPIGDTTANGVFAMVNLAFYF